MPVTLHASDVALRLIFTIVAGVLVGLNRGASGRAAGMRTTLLVCLAAAVAMIQANALMGTVGKAKDSFIVLDLMRLPLGILSGMGFIGAGAILRRGDLVLGVTTAATLWFVTVLGLCFGGGQLALGSVALVIGLIVLWGLKEVERCIVQEHPGMLLLTSDANGPTETAVRAYIEREGFSVVSWAVSYGRRGAHRTFRCGVRWRARRNDTRVPTFVSELARQPGVLRLNWKP